MVSNVIYFRPELECCQSGGSEDIGFRPNLEPNDPHNFCEASNWSDGEAEAGFVRGFLFVNPQGVGLGLVIPGNHALEVRLGCV